MTQVFRKAGLLAVGALLAACSTGPKPDALHLSDEPTVTRTQFADTALPPVKTFRAAPPPVLRVSNANLAQDFLDLHFQLENGATLSAFTRFETPVTVRLTGQVTPVMRSDLAALIGRLRNEAGIDIRPARPGQRASITIEATTRAQIQSALPTAACFVAPNVESLAEFRRNRRSDKTSWTKLTERRKMGIFLPADASPQEARDCLHEELAQALGPLNDLYRLPQSVFNDDNVHTVLTGWDMLVLRATYAPELRTGMSRAQVAAALPRVLDRLNPAGRHVPAQAVSATPRSWINDVQVALGRGSSEVSRQKAAGNALRIASSLHWKDHRRAFSHYMVGRSQQIRDPNRARVHFETAQALLAHSAGTELHRAFITTQTASYAIADGEALTALAQLEPAIAVAGRYQNAALLATLMLLKAEALEVSGRAEAAHSVRLDSLGWARYGFGPDWAVRAKMQEIASLRAGS